MLANPRITDYEREREENIRLNNEMLEKLGLGIPAKAAVITIKRKTKLDEVKEPKRRSLRVRGQLPVDSNLPTEMESNRYDIDPLTAHSNYDLESFKSGTLDLDKENASKLVLLQSLDEVVSDVSSVQSPHGSVNLSIPLPTGSVKVTPAMIFSIAFHPSSAKLLCAVGDKTGNMNFLDVSDTLLKCNAEDFEPVIYEFQPHYKPISKLMYDKENSNVIWSSSYDGSIRISVITN